jgi:hypothetical protein
VTNPLVNTSKILCLVSFNPIYPSRIISTVLSFLVVEGRWPVIEE